MKKSWLWLTIPIALLGTAASLVGILVDSTYERDAEHFASTAESYGRFPKPIWRVLRTKAKTAETLTVLMVLPLIVSGRFSRFHPCCSPGAAQERPRDATIEASAMRIRGGT